MSNPYKRLIALLPNTPLLVGEVVAYADGVATIELPGGGLMNARGDAAVSDRVFFRDGVIEGPAPAVTFQVLEV